MRVDSVNEFEDIYDALVVVAEQNGAYAPCQVAHLMMHLLFIMGDEIMIRRPWGTDSGPMSFGDAIRQLRKDWQYAGFFYAAFEEG